MTHPAHLLAFASLVVAGSIFFVVSLKIGLNGRRTLFILATLLGAFSSVHALYHLAEYLGMLLLADAVLLPVSALLFAVFSLYYWRSSSMEKRTRDTEAVLIGS